MQKCGSREPWKQRSIFHRVPAPISAPAQDGISPVRAEENAAGQEHPRDHGPAASDVDPFLARVTHDERSKREGEWHRHPNVAEAEHGWMNDHLRILQ